MNTRKIPGAVEMPEWNARRQLGGIVSKHKEEHPAHGKTYEKLLDCPREDCEGHIVRETEVSYPNPSGRMGGPRPNPHYEYRAFCNGCAQSYTIDVLEKLLKKPAP